MRITGRVRAAPAASLHAARALRLLVAARRALAAGTTTEEVLRALTTRRSTRADRAPDPAQAAAAVARAAAVLPGTTCVPRAVAMAALLPPSERHVVVALGSRRDESGRWVAHAWVEVDGVAWLAGVQPFQRLAGYDARRGWALVPGGDG